MVENFANRFFNDQIGTAVHVCRRFINQNEFVAVIVIDQSCSWVDDEGCTANNQHVCMANVVQGRLDNVFVEPFFVEDHIWFDRAATSITFRYACRMKDVFGIKEFAAIFTEVTQDAAV